MRVMLRPPTVLRDLNLAFPPFCMLLLVHSYSTATQANNFFENLTLSRDNKLVFIHGVRTNPAPFILVLILIAALYSGVITAYASLSPIAFHSEASFLLKVNGLLLLFSVLPSPYILWATERFYRSQCLAGTTSHA